jgi:hypothetical protein
MEEKIRSVQRKDSVDFICTCLMKALNAILPADVHKYVVPLILVTGKSVKKIYSFT